MTTFKQLKFKPRAGFAQPDGGVHALEFFKNGYGASVIRGYGTYGNNEGMYELAVLLGNRNSWSLTYDTPITGDVEGHLSEEAVTQLLRDIEALPSPARADEKQGA